MRIIMFVKATNYDRTSFLIHNYHNGRLNDKKSYKIVWKLI